MTQQLGNLKRSVPYIMTFLYPIVIFYLFESYTHNAFTTMKVPIQFLNMLLFELLFLFFYFCTGKTRAALSLETLLFALTGLANYFVLQFRSAPIMPWDIFSIKTAASVADNFKYTLSRNTVFTLLGFLLLLVLIFFTKCSLTLCRKWRIFGVVLSALCIFGFTSYVQTPQAVSTFRFYDKLFTPTVMSKRDGTAVAFLMELQYLTVKKPAGYSPEHTEEVLASHEVPASSPAKDSPSEKPNIIVIMNEAFSDLNILGELHTNEDYMPFVRSLMEGHENTVSGTLNVSVLGGNTANTEFEFLTGNTMAFLPQGSIPYQQYITGPVDSAPSYLKTLGYSTVGMHPYRAKGWERDRVYPLLGLDTSYFMDDFENPRLIRSYISDESNYEKIKEVYEGKKPEEPLFLFNVTMQNHSSYSERFDNFTPDIQVEGATSDSLEQYLSLVKESDTAFQELVSYFDSQEEDTILVFFGDHQPADSVVEPVWKNNGKSGASLHEEDLRLRYKVPFVIWANYPIQEETHVETSANFLASRILSLAGLPLSPYESYLASLETSYPVITSIQAVSKTGAAAPVSEVGDSLLEYEQMQYYQLFHTR